MEEQYDEKIMMIVSICAVVCGGVYYFLYNPNIKESKELTTKVNPAVESEVQENIEEEKKKSKLIMLAYLKIRSIFSRKAIQWNSFGNR